MTGRTTRGDKPMNAPTINDRLLEIVEKLSPATMRAYRDTGGVWPGRGAPYTIKPTPLGGKRVQVKSEEGDVLGGVGATLAEAVTMLRVKVGLESKKEESAHA